MKRLFIVLVMCIFGAIAFGENKGYRVGDNIAFSLYYHDVYFSGEIKGIYKLEDAYIMEVQEYKITLSKGGMLHFYEPKGDGTYQVYKGLIVELSDNKVTFSISQDSHYDNKIIKLKKDAATGKTIIVRE